MDYSKSIAPSSDKDILTIVNVHPQATPEMYHLRHCFLNLNGGTDPRRPCKPVCDMLAKLRADKQRRNNEGLCN